MADGLLLPYQVEWVRDRSPVKVCEKGRRIGLSWAEAYDAVLHAGQQDGGNVYYQSYDKTMTRGFIADCGFWCNKLNIGAKMLGEVLVDLGADGDHQAYKIELASGKEILAMTSAPRAFRSKGKPKDWAIVDEAAFVDDLGEVLKAAMAFLMWGGEVHVISTHNGTGNLFNALVSDVREGKRKGRLFSFPFRRAVRDGLPNRILGIRGVPITPKAIAAWVTEVRDFYGENAAEELDCVPTDGDGTWLTWDLIRGAEDERAGQPELHTGGATYIGVDIARRRHLWIAVALELCGDVLWTRELIARRNISFAEQTAIVGELINRYQPVRVAVDQTGMGEKVVEDWVNLHGSVVEGVLMNSPSQLKLATALKERLEDRRLRNPSDVDLRSDLRGVRKVTGPTGNPRLITPDRGDQHSDRFWAYALACGAAAEPWVEFEYDRVSTTADADDDYGYPDNYQHQASQMMPEMTHRHASTLAADIRGFA